MRARAAVGDAPVDLAVLPAENRRKRLLLSDMDSTMITIECIDELADCAGIKDEVAAITRRTMNGELDFAPVGDRTGGAAGRPARDGHRARSAATRCGRCRVRPRWCGRCARHGAHCVLVSGGFTQFTAYVRELLGFDLDEANELEIADGRLTGRLAGRSAMPAASSRHCGRHSHELGLGAADSLAVGDGANDLPMLQAAGLGVAFRAHPHVQAAAPINIRHGDLTALLYLQGYRATRAAA